MNQECITKFQKRSIALFGTLAAGAGAVLVYKYFVQPWHSTWGAAKTDVEREMTGDDLIENPTYVTTRAITIEARPEDIFPWLVQMGQGRGGAYTYDWIENLLGLNMHSADRIVPELQYLKAGDFLPMGSGGSGMIVQSIEKNLSLVLRHTDGNWTWSFGLYPLEDGKTKLVSRNRISAGDAGVAFRWYLKLLDPGAFIMERKMLLGIKERVERTPALREIEASQTEVKTMSQAA